MRCAISFPACAMAGLLASMSKKRSIWMLHALHQGFLRGFKSSGGTLHTNEEVQFADYVGDAWRVETRQAKYAARVMVNAGGAWGDDIARRCGVQPLGLSCLRRSVHRRRRRRDCERTSNMGWGLYGSSMSDYDPWVDRQLESYRLDMIDSEARRQRGKNWKMRPMPRKDMSILILSRGS